MTGLFRLHRRVGDDAANFMDDAVRRHGVVRLSNLLASNDQVAVGGFNDPELRASQGVKPIGGKIHRVQLGGSELAVCDGVV